MLNEFNQMYFTKEVQTIVKNAARRLSREYADKGIDREDLEQQSYLCFISLMEKFNFLDQIEDFANPPQAAVGYIGQYLPMKLKDYVWEQADIKRTKKGYKSSASLVEYNPALHDQEIEMDNPFVETNEYIVDALNVITDKQREVIELEYLKGAEDVPALLDIKPGTYRKRKMDALEAMKRSMGSITLQEALAV